MEKEFHVFGEARGNEYVSDEYREELYNDYKLIMYDTFNGNNYFEEFGFYWANHWFLVWNSKNK